VWSYLCLEAEIPKPGDFRTTWLGETPVLISRGMKGEVFACENRCAHRGALVRREAGGNDTSHTCIYHRWNYQLNGDLRGIPFQRGIKDQGGMDKDFDKSCHGLAKLRVATYRGVVFGSFSEKAEPLESYLGKLITSHLDMVMQKPTASRSRTRRCCAIAKSSTMAAAWPHRRCSPMSPSRGSTTPWLRARFSRRAPTPSSWCGPASATPTTRPSCARIASIR